MLVDEQFDLFLAYYGDRVNGTEEAAYKLYYALSSAVIPGKASFKCYFHPVTNPHGVFEETPQIVARTPLFILVVDKYIPRTNEGQLQKYREDGRLRNLYEEVRSFHNSNMYKQWGGDNAAKLYITDDFNFNQAEQLHSIFSGRTALNRVDSVISWISEFFSKTQPERVFQNTRALLIHNRKTFDTGEWCNGAEREWRRTHFEPLGRLLLSFYVSQALKKRSNDTEVHVRQLYKELRAIPHPSQETLTLLSMEQIQRILAV